MDGLITTYWPQLLALLAFAAWLIRLEAAVKSLSSLVAEMRRRQDETERRAQDQAVMLGRIDESLKAIQITLDRLAARIERTEK